MRSPVHRPVGNVDVWPDPPPQLLTPFLGLPVTGWFGRPRGVLVAVAILVFGCASGGGGASGDDNATPPPPDCLSLASIAPPPTTTLGRLPGLAGPVGVALLPVCDETTAFVLSEGTGELSVANLTTGQVDLVATLSLPFAAVREPDSRSTLLITEHTRLVRVNVLNKSVTAVASFNSPTGLVIDPSRPDSVLVAEAASLYRVSRASGAKTLLVNDARLAGTRALAVQEPGVVLAVIGNPASGQVVRVDLRQNPPALTELITPRSDLRNPFGVDLRDGFAFITAQFANQMVRFGEVTSATPTLEVFTSGLKGPTGIARLADGRLVIAQSSTNDLVVLDPAACATPPCAAPAPAVAGLGTPGDLALDEDGSILVLERNGGDATAGAGTLSRVDSRTGKVTLVASGLDLPEAVAVIGRTAYVAERGSVVTPTGRLVAVSLEQGTVTPFGAGGLGAPSGLARLNDTALVMAERWSGRISRVTVPGGGIEEVTFTGAAPQNPVAVVMENATHALVTDYAAGKLLRVQVEGCSPCTSEPLPGDIQGAMGVALEPTRPSALVVSEASGTITRVFLSGSQLPSASSAIVSGLNNPQRIMIEPGGATALVTEVSPDGIRRVAIPAP